MPHLGAPASRNIITTAVLTALAATAVQTAAAQSAPAAPPAASQSLTEVTVQAGSLEQDIPQELLKSGTRIDVITDQDVRNINVVDVATALENLAPGLYVAPKNGPFDYVNASLQGSRTGDILWLVDGVRINNRLYNGTTPLDTLPSSMIDHIEEIEGGQALFYGTQAVAGAVNIVTKGFSQTPTGSVTVAADTNTSEHLDGNFSDTIGGNKFVLYGSADNAVGFQPFRSQDYQPSSTERDRGYDVFTLGAKYAYDFSSDLHAGLDYQHTSGQLDDASPYLVQKAYNTRDEDLIKASLDATLNEDLQILIKPYYHSWRSHYTEYDNATAYQPAQVPEEDGPWGYRDYGTNVLAKIQFDPRFEYFVGYDLQRYTGSDAVLVITQHTENTNAAFAQARTTSALFPDLILAVGARYSDPSVGEGATVWNFSGKYDLGAGFFLRGQAGSAFRLPTAEELFANDPQDERGDPELKPEKSHNANLSFGQNLKPGDVAMTWELIGFYRNISNLIDYTSFDSTTDQSVFGNVPGTVKIRGGEFSFDVAANNTVSGHLDFTYNHSSNVLNPLYGTLEASDIPDNLLKMQVDVHPPGSHFGGTATLTRVGTAYATGMWNGNDPYGNYFVLDLNGRYFIDEAQRHRIDLSVQNLFNHEYATGLGSGTLDSSPSVDNPSNYTYWNRGLPRTFRIAYTYRFE